MRKTIIDKFSDEDKQVVEETIKEGLEWLDTHQDETEAQVYEDKYKEIETVMMPIMTKLYQSQAPDMSGMGGMPDMSGGMPDMPPKNEQSSSGPTIEEVD